MFSNISNILGLGQASGKKLDMCASNEYLLTQYLITTKVTYVTTGLKYIERMIFTVKCRQLCPSDSLYVHGVILKNQNQF